MLHGAALYSMLTSVGTAMWTRQGFTASSCRVAKRSTKDFGIPTPRMLAAARLLADMSQADLAEASGVHRTVIGRYEAEATVMRSDRMARLVAALGRSGVHFIGDASTPSIGIVIANPFSAEDAAKD